MDANDSAWTLTLASAPLAVGKRLARRNLEHRLFKLKVRRLRRGQMRDEVTPAFGRYVFTRVEPARREELRSVLGVYGFVRDGTGAPAQVSDAVVSELADARAKRDSTGTRAALWIPTG